MMVCCEAASAFSGGIAGHSGKNTVFCSACHIRTGVAMEPTVTFQGPTTLDPGMTGHFTFTVHSNRRQTQTAGGLGLAASGGTLIPGTGVRDLFGNGAELGHNGPKANDSNDDAVFAFDWTAPTTPGTYTLFGAGNSVNLNGFNTGDAATKTTMMVSVGTLASPTPTPSATAPPPTTTATATRTLSSTPSPTSTLAPTLTPTFTVPTDTPTPTATPTPSRTPTRAVTPGDANCNNRITAADLVSVTELAIACQAACEIDNSVCGVDVNRDLQINQQDIEALIELLFGD